MKMESVNKNLKKLYFSKKIPKNRETALRILKKVCGRKAQN